MAKRRALTGNGANIEINFDEPNPKQKEFFLSRATYTCYGGAKGGGKTWAVRVKAILGALTNDGIKILIMRQTYPELQENHITPILKMVPPEVASYNATNHIMNFVNGSTIKFGHWAGEESEQEYNGLEYDWIFIDEATQFTERAFQFLGGCLRGVNDFPKRMYLTCNPGGVGHSWVKRLFIKRQFRVDPDNPEASENPKDYVFIPATVDDNVALAKTQGGKQYVRMLAQMPEDLRKAYRYGDWDAIEGGSYFSEFSEATHVCKPFKIPDHWKRYRSFDYGLDKFHCLWWAVDEDGRAWCYREYGRKGLIVQEAAAIMREHTLPGENIITTYAPPDMWSRQKDTGRTMAELYMQNGINITRSDNNRVQGHMVMKEMLAPIPVRDRFLFEHYGGEEAENIKKVTENLSKEGKAAVEKGIGEIVVEAVRKVPDKLPAMMFFNNCREIIEDIQEIQHDEANPNDCAKEPHDITHSIDACRYFAINRKLPAEIIAESPTNKYNDWLASLDGGSASKEDYNSYMCGGEPSRAYIGVA